MSAPRLMRRRLATFATATVFARGARWASGRVAAQVSPEEVLSHFLCYRGTFAEFARVSERRLQGPVRDYNATVVGARDSCATQSGRRRRDRATSRRSSTGGST